jgi:hypothetical protein
VPVEQIDQQNLVSNNYEGDGPGGLGQSFTAGKTGKLTSVEFEVICGQGMSDGALEIYSGAHDASHPVVHLSDIIASQLVPASVWPACESPQPWTQTTRAWVRVSFDTPASVVAGSQYTFRLNSSAGTAWHSVSSFADKYAGGLDWVFMRDWDAIFKTYVLAPDGTPPVITPVIAGPLGQNGWYTHDVTVSWTVTDDASDITSSSGCTTSIVTESTRGATFTCAATSGGGTASNSVTIKMTKDGPSLHPIVSPNPIVLNGVGDITANASDEFSGLASVTCDPVITSSVGPGHSACTAIDSAGFMAVVNAPFTVVYGFTGFLAPVDAAPVVNVTKAGSAVPVKFSLGGDRGLAIMAPDYPASQAMSCSASDPTADLEETLTAGNSSLSYDPVSGVYTYIWKTEKSWTGTCRKLSVKLIDGTEHVAYFKFGK